MFCKRSVVLLSLTLTALFLEGRTASACSCGGRATVLESFEWANVVVIAQAVSVEKAEGATDGVRSLYVDGVRSTRMIVEKVFKGTLKPGEEMIFAQGGGADCIWTFSEKSIGERFLFYLSGKNKEQKIWFAGTCGRSRKAEYAADDLLYLDNMAKALGKTRLSGTLSFYQASSAEGESAIYKGLDGRRVRVIGEKKIYELITDQSGVYEMYDLPPGKYAVEPEIPDGWTINYSTPSAGSSDSEDHSGSTSKKSSSQVVLTAGKHAFVNFGYGIHNAIRGKVFDTAGNGMKDVCLAIVPTQGKAADKSYNFDCTEKDGTFEIAGITPGSYVIAINRGGKISSEVPFQTFYYPNVFEPEKAAVITIGAGHILEDVNIYVPRMEETITVEGVALYSDGKPVIEGSVAFEPETTGAGIEGNARTRTDLTGRFTIKILKGLKGTLYGAMFTYAGEYVHCPKLEELIKQSRERVPSIRTSAIDMRADENIPSVELRFPFPLCKKAK